MLSKIVTLFVLVQPLASLWAQGSGGQAGEFLRWGVGGKALGLGRAFTAVADDASAMYWNPAGMSALSRSGGTFMIMHAPLQEGAAISYIGAALPMQLFFANSYEPSPLERALRSLKLGVGFVWHSLGNFEFYDDQAIRVDGLSGTSIGESAFYLSASYPFNGLFRGVFNSESESWSRAFSGDLELGLSAKFIRQDLFGSNGSANSYDIGLKYTHFSRLFSLGLAFRDINSPALSYDNGITADRIAANSVIGASVHPDFGVLRGLTLSLDYGLKTPGDRDRDLMFGLEYDLSAKNPEWPLKLRLGANSNHESLTLGIGFSPNLVLGRDWIPAADIAYANDKSALSGANGRYTISIDKNPFIARYWYRRALGPMSDSDHKRSLDPRLRQEIHEHFTNAELAKNPGKTAYRYEAALRKADMAFLNWVQRNSASEEYSGAGLQVSIARFREVAHAYGGRAARYLKMDAGKQLFDSHRYFISYLYFLESLILSGQFEGVFGAKDGLRWGMGSDVLGHTTGDSARAQADKINYLKAFAYFRADFTSESVSLINQRLPHSAVAQYLKGHIAFLKGHYQEVLDTFALVDLNDTAFPEHIYIPLTNDGTFGDETLMLRALSMFQLPSEYSPNDYVAEVANILRYFPKSDVAKFLTNKEDIFANLVEYYENYDNDRMDTLMKKMIRAYVDASSQGRLGEQVYTSNYR